MDKIELIINDIYNKQDFSTLDNNYKNLYNLNDTDSTDNKLNFIFAC